MTRASSPPPGDARRSNLSRPRRWRVVLAFVVPLLALALPLGAVLWVRHFAVTPQGAPMRPPALITIEDGESASAIAAQLEREGVVRPAWLFIRLARWTGRDKDLQAGDYRFDFPISPQAVMDILRRDSPAVRTVTVPEGLTLEDAAALIARSGVAPERDLLAVFRDPSPVRKLDPQARTLEGYLWPGTYRFSERLNAARVAAALLRAFDRRVVEPYGRVMAAQNRSLHDVVTLASLVEKETAQPEERPRIAGVFLDRLERGMRLQCDPTVIYASRVAGRPIGDLHRRDLEWDHPYNTYTRAGLPPGPIASPGMAAVLAALRPQRTGALYFVARGDGTHIFSATLREHERAVRSVQR